MRAIGIERKVSIKEKSVDKFGTTCVEIHRITEDLVIIQLTRKGVNYCNQVVDNKRDFFLALRNIHAPGYNPGLWNFLMNNEGERDGD